MTRKHEILDALSRVELLALVDRFGVGVIDKRVRDTIVQGLAQAPRVDLVKVLEGLNLDRVKELCRFHGIDDSGRNKDVLLKRLTGVREEPADIPSGQTGAILDYKEFKAALFEAHLPAYLDRLLESAQGNVTKAARDARISRSHLQTLMQRYKVGTGG